VAPIEGQLFVIFGATGDLGRNKLLPALHRALVHEGHAEKVAVLGVGTTQRSDEDFRSLAEQALLQAGMAADHVEAWCRRLHYEPFAVSHPDLLAKRVQELEAEHHLPGNRVFYLALPPSVVGETVDAIGTAGLATGGRGWSRLVVEKPFGHDLESARSLNAAIDRFFDEDDVYRIDHYLGKETVRNLLVFRFANSLFERTWNRDHIASVEITMAEDLGLDGRGRYYDESGAIRDVVQNHMTQLLSLIAMEPPVEMDADSIRAEKIKALRSVSTVSPLHVVTGQFAGYREIDGVSPTSITPTYVALQLAIENWRWQGVPFLLRTGKELPRRVTRITVRYRKPPVCLFHAPGACPGHENLLRLTLQPDEGFDLLFDVKKPGDRVEIQQIPLSVRYDDWLGDLPDAYHTLLLDIMEGDQTLFVHGDEVEESWRIYSEILDRTEPSPYEPGSAGPSAAAGLAEGAGAAWTDL
jgi:glucose-6-phosphate 1-dehydrogenase